MTASLSPPPLEPTRMNALGITASKELRDLRPSSSKEPREKDNARPSSKELRENDLRTSRPLGTVGARSEELVGMFLCLWSDDASGMETRLDK